MSDRTNASGVAAPSTPRSLSDLGYLTEREKDQLRRLVSVLIAFLAGCRTLRQVAAVLKTVSKGADAPEWLTGRYDTLAALEEALAKRVYNAPEVPLYRTDGRLIAGLNDRGEHLCNIAAPLLAPERATISAAIRAAIRAANGDTDCAT